MTHETVQMEGLDWSPSWEWMMGMFGETGGRLGSQEGIHANTHTGSE